MSFFFCVDRWPVKVCICGKMLPVSMPYLWHTTFNVLLEVRTRPVAPRLLFRLYGYMMNHSKLIYQRRRSRSKWTPFSSSYYPIFLENLGMLPVIRLSGSSCYLARQSLGFLLPGRCLTGDPHSCPVLRFSGSWGLFSEVPSLEQSLGSLLPGRCWTGWASVLSSSEVIWILSKPGRLIWNSGIFHRVPHPKTAGGWFCLT